MGNDKKPWHRYVPFKSTAAGLAREFGVWRALAGVIILVIGAMGALWAWLESQLPYWAIGLVFLAIVVGLGVMANQVAGVMLKRKQGQAIDKLVSIDRDALATELEVLSGKIAALVGEFRGPLQEAQWADFHARRAGNLTGDTRARIEGKLIEKYSDRHGADVWRLIRRASKVIPLDRSDVWRIQHGIRSEMDLQQVCMFLATLADDVRYPSAPLPEVDRRMEAHERAIAQAHPPLPSVPK